MADKLKEIPGKILEWWNKFTNKQKTIIIVVAAAIIFTFVIIIYTFTRPSYALLGTYESSTEGSEVIDILDDAGITHRESNDIRTIEVLTSQLAQANYALASAGYTPERLKYSDFVESGMSVTSSDKENQYKLFLQAEIENALKSQNSIKNAIVLLTIPSQTGTLYSQQQKEEASATVQLTLNGTFSSANATAVARAVATCLGNSTTANITIVDQDSNLLFVGGDDYTAAGIANSMQELQQQAEAMVANKVKQAFYGTGQFDSINVAGYLSVDYSTYQNTVQEYYSNDGSSRGMVLREDNFSSSSEGGTGGVPGTDSNGGDLTDYDYPDYSTSSSTQEESSLEYQNNMSLSIIDTPAGGVDVENSTLAISLIKYREYNEESVKAQGLLDGVTWEEFKLAHEDDVKLTVDEEFVQLAAQATGIPAENIVIIAYESPIFHDKDGLNISATDIASIIMIILILALLGFVVLRSMGSKKEVAEEEELSVESMLQSTPETTMDDIDVETKSETRKLIEKFVDDNPEAAANLLRNWLNEDWG